MQERWAVAALFIIQKHVGTQCMVALVFYLKWHVIEVLNLLENMLFKTCKTWRRGTCLSCTVIAWKSPFYEAGATYKIWSILCLHINGNNSKYSRSWGGPVSPEGRNGFWAGQGQQWKDHEFYMLHIINSHIWNGNSAAVSVNVEHEQSVQPVFITVSNIEPHTDLLPVA